METKNLNNPNKISRNHLKQSKEKGISTERITPANKRLRCIVQREFRFKESKESSISREGISGIGKRRSKEVEGDARKMKR